MKQEINESIIFGMTYGLMGGLIVGIIGGLTYGLMITFITNLIALLNSNPELVMFDLVVSGLLILGIQVIGWIVVYRMRATEKYEEVF